MLPETLETARLLLRPITVGDAKAVYTTYGQDTAVTRYLIWEPHKSVTDASDFIAACLAADQTQWRTYAITRLDSKTLIGAFDLRLKSPHHLSCGYVLARPHWGHGYMTEALTAAITWAFTQPAIFRVSAYCDIENTGSARVMEKSGMSREGTLKRYLVHPGLSPEPRDCFIYAKTL